MRQMGDLALSKQSESWVYTPTPSAQTYVPLLTAFSHFNSTLFRNALPDCLITLQRKANTYGYFSPNKFTAIGGDAQADEIALNPAHFRVCTPKDVCSTLVHEMVHLWQEHFGSPSRAGYHNRQWAAVMRRIGLEPISADGKGTGYSVNHAIVEGGPFDLSFQAFAASNPTIAWGDAFTHSGETRKPKRLTFVCPSCGQKVMGVPKTRVRCEFCGLPMVANRKGEPTDAGATPGSVILAEPS
jgi:predicted SprT family Zn-dependent metalloprotease